MSREATCCPPFPFIFSVHICMHCCWLAGNTEEIYCEFRKILQVWGLFCTKMRKSHILCIIANNTIADAKVKLVGSHYRKINNEIKCDKPSVLIIILRFSHKSVLLFRSNSSLLLCLLCMPICRLSHLYHLSSFSISLTNQRLMMWMISCQGFFLLVFCERRRKFYNPLFFFSDFYWHHFQMKRMDMIPLDHCWFQKEKLPHLLLLHNGLNLKPIAFTSVAMDYRTHGICQWSLFNCIPLIPEKSKYILEGLVAN